MDNNKKEINSNKLEFNTYCIFSNEKQDITNVIGLMFKDFLDLELIEKGR